MSLLANIRRLFILRVSSQILLLFSIIIFTRFADPNVLGKYFYFEALLGIVGLFVAFGIGGSTEKFVSEESEENLWYSTGLALTILFTIFGSLIFVITNSIFEILDYNLMNLFVIALISKQFITFYRHIFRSELRAAFDGVINLLTSLIFLIISFIGLYLGYGIEGIILGYISSRVLIIPVSIKFTERKIVIPSLDKAIDLIQFAKYYFINVISDKVFNYIDIIVIGLLLSSTKVGQYNVSWKLISAAILLNGIFAKTLFSYVSGSSSEGDMAAVSSDLDKTLKYVLILPFATILGSLVLGEELVKLLFTADYTAGSYLLVALAAGFIFQPIYFLFSRVLVAMGKPKQSLIGTLVAALANIILNVVFVSIIGLIGAAIATTLSFMIASISFYIILHKTISVTFPLKRYLIQLTSAIIMIIVLVLIRSSIKTMSSLDTILIFTFGGLVYISILYSHPLTRQDLTEILREA